MTSTPNDPIAPQSASSSKTGSNKTLIRVIIILSILIVVALGCMAFVYYNSYGDMKTSVEIDTIYDPIYINGVNVGNLTEYEAIELLKEQIQTPLDTQTIVLVGPGIREEYPLSYFGASYDIEAAVAVAYAYGREGSVKERYDKIQALATTPLEIAIEVETDEQLLRNAIEVLDEELHIEATDATISRSNGVFRITPEEPGQKLDVEGTFQQAKALFDKLEGGTVELIIEPIEPEHKATDFANAQSLIGTAYSVYSPGENGRNTNIKTALAKINDYVVYPGEVFSTNEAFGPTTYENGYRAAPVIIGGKLEDDFGGGVCQVSSTLYNALLYAELEIVERQNHSLKVAYMDWGFDATLAGNYIDLKFRNDTEYPVFIEGYIESNKVIVNIYGHEIHDQGRSLEFFNKFISSTPPGEELVKEDPALPLGERVVESPARTGYKYEVYKSIYQNGQLVDTVLVNTSVYKATRAEVRVGTGESPAQTVENTPDATEAPQESNNGSNETNIPAPEPTVPPNAEVPPSVIEEALRNMELEPVMPE